ncbi:mitochondrial carrier domain-containing protein [Peziza echinospora]|nr:mitochondrial carrier domain-containing protein [Peziza echinospora]
MTSEPIPQLDEGGGLKRTMKDLFAGAAGGVAQVLLGQPFDIIKVRLQTSTAVPPPTAIQTALSLYKSEGPLSFYKGTLTPLLGIGACVSVQFGAFHYARRQIQSLLNDPAGRKDLTYSQYYLAGAFAGIANTPLSAPIEHVRIRLQTQPPAHLNPGGVKLYSGPGECIKKLLKHGSLYRGTTVTLLREAQAYGVWFLTFEYLMNTEPVRKDVPSWKVALYGGLAGEALWLASYPFDVVKSRMQTDGLARGERRYASMRDCFGKTFREGGVGAFWKGIGPTLLRAMPVSAGTFFVVEMTMRAIADV